MAQWQMLSRMAQPSLGKAVAGLGLLVIVAELSQAPFPLDDLLGGTVRLALRVLPSLVLATCHLVQGHFTEHIRLCEGLLQAAACWWPALLHLASAV